MALTLIFFFSEDKWKYDEEFTSNVLTGKQLQRSSGNNLPTNSVYILKNTKFLITLAEKQQSETEDS